MKEVAIKDICEKGSSALKQKELLPEGKYPVYGASGIAGYLDSYQQENEYIGIVKDGSGIGRVAFYPEKTSLIGTMQYILPKKGYKIRYIGYCLQSLDLSKYKQGAAIPHIYFSDYGERVVKITSDVQEQNTIVERLDAAFSKIDALKTNAEHQLAEARYLYSRALTEEMKPKEGWDESLLGNIGTFKNGMNFSHNEKGYDLNIVGVGDFGNRFSIDNVEELTTVSLNQMPSEDYLLKDGDIVFVRSNGNKQLVGRSLVVYPKCHPVTFSGFCIRFRKSTTINERYLTYYLKCEGVRKKLFGNGANISNLNQKILQNLAIPIPSEDQQSVIVSYLDVLSDNVRKLEDVLTRTLTECDALKQAILKEVFE